MKTVLFVAILTFGITSSALSFGIGPTPIPRYDEYCAQNGDTTVKRIFLDQLKGHVEGNDYIVTFIPQELECKDGEAYERPTNLKLVTVIDDDYKDLVDGGYNPYKIVPQVSTSNTAYGSYGYGQLQVTVRFANGAQDLFSGNGKTQRRFYTSIGFWFTASFYLIISKNNPAHPKMAWAQ
jgi:hypothetical protein